MKNKRFFSALLVLVSTATAQSPLYGTCGGINWAGPTTCVSGSICVYSNPYYSQCLPGTVSVSSTKPSSTLTSIGQSSSTTSVSISSSSTLRTVTSTQSSTGPSSSPTAGTSFSAKLWATHYSGTVSTLTFSKSGSVYSLTATTQTTCGTMPSWLTYDPITETLYCVDEFYSGGTLSTYSVSSTGSLSQTAKIAIPNNGVHSTLYGGTNGDSFLAIAHYQSSQFSTFALPITSSSKALQKFTYTMSKAGPNPSRQEAPHPHMALLDPTGKYMLVPDLGADIIRIYSINTATGILTSCSNYTDLPGSGPRHGSWFVPGSSTVGTMLYITHELANTVSAYAVTYTSSCLSLSLTQSIAPYPGGKIPVATTPNGVKVAEVRVRGSTLLSSNRADNSFGASNDSIALFTLEPSTGALAFNTITSAFGSYPRTFQISSAGDYVAIGDQNSAWVSIVERDPATGILGALAGRVTLGSQGTDGNGGLSSVIWMG